MSSGVKWMLGMVLVVACAALVAADHAMAQCGGCSTAKSACAAKSECEAKTTCAAKSACAAKSECEAKCPVSGEAVSKEASMDYKGGKLCFCCAGCIAKFKADTAKYQAKANEQLVITGQAKQVHCPCGGKPNPSIKTKVCGIDVCFCCEKCQEKVKSASGDKQPEMVFVKGFDKAFAVKQEKKKQADK